MEKKIIKGFYLAESRYGPKLELRGPFDRRSIDEVIQKQVPFPCSFGPEEEDKKGMASFIVDNEESALDLVKKLNNSLSGYNFFIDYTTKHS